MRDIATEIKTAPPMRSVKVLMLVSICLLAALLSNCVSEGVTNRLKGLDKKDVEIEKKLELQKPTMAELMTGIQAHHARLYFAGQAGNWRLAEHEVQRIKAELEKAGKLHDKWEDVPKPLSVLIPLITHAEIEKITEATRAGDKRQFTDSFQNLTKDCNTCHQAAKRDFIVIQIPTQPGSTNLQFKVP
jgi:cytochrome c556